MMLPTMTIAASDSSDTCITRELGVPWIYAGCGSTLPALRISATEFSGEPRPFIIYNPPMDAVGRMLSSACGADVPLRSSSGYIMLDSFEYYLL
jgi:hypothetical protein